MSRNKWCGGHSQRSPKREVEETQIESETEGNMGDNPDVAQDPMLRLLDQLNIGNK
jgi:hypothetical protein